MLFAVHSALKKSWQAEQIRCLMVATCVVSVGQSRVGQQQAMRVATTSTLRRCGPTTNARVHVNTCNALNNCYFDNEYAGQPDSRTQPPRNRITVRIPPLAGLVLNAICVVLPGFGCLLPSHPASHEHEKRHADTRNTCQDSQGARRWFNATQKDSR